MEKTTVSSVLASDSSLEHHLRTKTKSACGWYWRQQSDERLAASKVSLIKLERYEEVAIATSAAKASTEQSTIAVVGSCLLWNQKWKPSGYMQIAKLLQHWSAQRFIEALWTTNKNHHIICRSWPRQAMQNHFCKFQCARYPHMIKIHLPTNFQNQIPQASFEVQSLKHPPNEVQRLLNHLHSQLARPALLHSCVKAAVSHQGCVDQSCHPSSTS